MPEKESNFISEEKDFSNEDLRRKTMESGSDEELYELYTFLEKHGMGREEFERIMYYAKLRKSAIETSQKEIKEKEKTSPQPTDEELDMGVYKEMIEPQAREAVIALRQKGYSTYESGFWGADQKISFLGDPLRHYKFSEDFEKDLEAQGVKISITPKSIVFLINEKVGVEEIKEIWNKIVSALPDLGKPAERNSLKAAIDFRKKFGK